MIRIEPKFASNHPLRGVGFSPKEIFDDLRTHAVHASKFRYGAVPFTQFGPYILAVN